jgi:membrane protein
MHERMKTTLMGRLLAAVLAIGAGSTLVVVTVASAMLSYWNANSGPLEDWLLRHVSLIIRGFSWLVVGLIFTTILKYLPMRCPPWKPVLLGSLAASILFEVGKYYIGLYVARSVIASAYGPSSTIVAILIWIYYSIQTFLAGAKICRYCMDRQAAPLGDAHRHSFSQSTSGHSHGRPRLFS